jgi:hypothetical protein
MRASSPPPLTSPTRWLPMTNHAAKITHGVQSANDQGDQWREAFIQVIRQ